MYDIKDEDIEGVVDQSRLLTDKESSALQKQLPVLELLKVCRFQYVCLGFSTQNFQYSMWEKFTYHTGISL